MNIFLRRDIRGNPKNTQKKNDISYNNLFRISKSYFLWWIPRKGTI